MCDLPRLDMPRNQEESRYRLRTRTSGDFENLSLQFTGKDRGLGAIHEWKNRLCLEVQLLSP